MHQKLQKPFFFLLVSSALIFLFPGRRQAAVGCQTCIYQLRTFLASEEFLGDIVVVRADMLQAYCGSLKGQG
jgi:hypothetical protein